ncbi:hypothetical protein FACS189419_09270 [Planctomycetales bacterium]|nr:hypothetical protein FACS189419_09270 [Planctomycetales bacterium]
MFLACNPNFLLSRFCKICTIRQAAAWLYNDLTAKTGYVPVEPKVRVEQARKALVWLKEIVEESRQGRKIYHFDDLESAVLDALQSPIRLPEGLELAAAIKSAVMQKAIYEIAANAVNSMPVRNTAEAAFELSVKTHGVLLRGREVQAVYDRYNASEHEPKESQELLNRLIDIVENKVLNK